MKFLTFLASARRLASGRRLESVQILRGVAALLVVHNHAGYFIARNPDLDLGRSWLAPSDAAAATGAIGVDLFFIISGFVMAHTARQLRGCAAARDFLLRRWLRIAPLYYLMAAVMAAVILVGGGGFSRDSVVNTLVFIPILDDAVYSWPIHYLGWTLAFEFVFYALVAASVALRLGARPRVLIALTVALPVIGWIFPPGPAALRMLLNPMLLEFGFGVAAYWMWRTGRLERYAPAFVALAIGVPVAALLWTVALAPARTTVFVAVAADTLAGIDSLPRVVYWGLPMWLVFCAVLGTVTNGVHGWFGRLFLVLGDASYSLYLTHLAVVRVLEEVAGRYPLHADVAIVLAFVGASLLGVQVYRRIERPFLERSKALMNARRA